MVMQGETIFTGAPKKCNRCGLTVKLNVYLSPAGWYIGTKCLCGPYTRETSYLTTEEEAQDCLTEIMNTGYHPAIRGKVN